MIIVFDLDDTLYNEVLYVRSGFRVVAKYLSKNFKLKTPEIIYKELIRVLENKGRGNVFNDVLSKYNIYSRKNVKKCLSIYRLHHPKIHLSKAGKNCLERLKNLPKYLVTDGNKIVQKQKIKTLKIESYFKKMIPTSCYGLKYSKPSTYCFHKILRWEKATPLELLYIGDNPNKDFINLKKEGFRTLQVLTGAYKKVKMPARYQADFKVNTLNEITPTYLKQLYSF